MPYCEQKHLCVQLRSWRTRIALLLLYMVLSMVAAMTVTLSVLSPAGHATSGIMLEVRRTLTLTPTPTLTLTLTPTLTLTLTLTRCG